MLKTSGNYISAYRCTQQGFDQYWSCSVVKLNPVPFCERWRYFPQPVLFFSFQGPLTSIPPEELLRQERRSLRPTDPSPTSSTRTWTKATNPTKRIPWTSHPQNTAKSILEKIFKSLWSRPRLFIKSNASNFATFRMKPIRTVISCLILPGQGERTNNYSGREGSKKSKWTRNKIR